MGKYHRPDWRAYWAAYSDLDELETKSSNLDETLRSIEEEFECKLLSGDHMQIVTALEERITELGKANHPQTRGKLVDA